MTQSTGITVSQQALASESRAENSCAVNHSAARGQPVLGSHYEGSQDSTSCVTTLTLIESPTTSQTVRMPGVKAGNVWSEFLCARRDLMLEVLRLRTARKEHVQDAVALLSSMLRSFSEDVLQSQHMCSAAAAAVAPSAPAGLTQPTETTQTQQLHSERIAGCSTALEGRNRGFMSSLHAHGIMHAVEHMSAVHATTFTAGGATQSCPQLPDIEAGGAGEGHSSQVQHESGCDVECTEAIETATGGRDPPAATLEPLPPTDEQYRPTWHKVCMKSSRSLSSSC
jgi:hypothetical protein